MHNKRGTPTLFGDHLAMFRWEFQPQVLRDLRLKLRKVDVLTRCLQRKGKN